MIDKVDVTQLNLSEADTQAADKFIREAEWHPSMYCPACGDNMFKAQMGKKLVWLCRSWIYFEGGCEWME